MNRQVRSLAAAFTLIAGAASAHHPGARLNEVMAAKEPAFEAPDHMDAPEFALTDPTGRRVVLSDFDGKVLVMSIVQSNCGSDCVRQQTALASVQKRVNVAPMRNLVRFVTIVAPDSVLPAGVGAAFDPTTWQMLSSGPDVVDLAAAYAAASRSGTLPMTFVVDRFGRIAGIFHGSAFGQVNMLLYINGLTNEHEKREPTFWQRVWVAFQ